MELGSSLATCKGMKAFSKLDKEVFDEFAGKRKELTAITQLIRATVKDEFLVKELHQLEDDLDESSISVREGKVIYRLHRHIERKPSIIQKKKEWKARL